MQPIQRITTPQFLLESERMMQQVRKAVIPAAGLGTRFLPATKSTPKEMLAVVDKPAIQYVIEEAVAAGIDELLHRSALRRRRRRVGPRGRGASGGPCADRTNPGAVAALPRPAAR